MRQLDDLRRSIRMIDFGLAAVAAVALSVVGLDEVAWAPFACLAMTSGAERGSCRKRSRRLSG